MGFRLTLFFVTIFLFYSLNGNSQCCSPGNPIGGTANIGTVKRNGIRSVLFFRHSYSDRHYEGSREAELQDTRAHFNFIGSVLGYGITKNLTVESELGYFISKSRNSEIVGEEKSNGLSNALVSFKYSLWKNPIRAWELSLGAGFRFPLSRQLKRDINGNFLIMDVQPSTGATGFVGQFFLYKGFIPQDWRFFLINRFEYNGKNDIEYKYGTANYTSLFITKSLSKKWTGIIQFRNEWRGHDDWGGILLANTGSNVFIISPQASLNISKQWNITFLAEVPVYRHYNLSQLGAKYAVAVNVSRDFNL